MDDLSWSVLSYVTELGAFVLLDWLLPFQARNAIFSILKSEPEVFRVRYREGRKVRFAIAVGLTLLQIVVDRLANDVFKIAILVLAIAGYSCLVAYYIWCAETGRKSFI